MSSDSGLFNHEDDESHYGSEQLSPVSDLPAAMVQATDSGIVDENLNYKFRSFVQNKDEVKDIWAVNFNHFMKCGQPKIFAAVGGPRFWIYEVTSNGKMKLLMCGEDDDSEEFWTCCWTLNLTTHEPILVLGGKRGVIRVIDIDLTTNVTIEPKNLIGHGDGINQLKVASHYPYLIASASKDHSIRLWNIQTNVCVAIFHGIGAHRDSVVSIDFNFKCTKLLSGGCDHIIAIWDLTTPQMKAAIEQSTKYKTNKIAFKTVIDLFPMFSTRLIHQNYVDCVEWFGDLILSKSTTEHDLCCWMVGVLPCEMTFTENKSIPSDECSQLIKFNIKQCQLFSTRFATDKNRNILAIGNMNGEVQLYKLEPNGRPFQTLRHRQRMKCNVRDLSFSRDGHSLVFCSDDGKIWLYQN